MRRAGRWITFVGILGVATLAASGVKHLVIPPAEVPVPPPRLPRIAKSPDTTTLLASMATLAGVLPEREKLAEWAKKIDAGEPVEPYIDELLANERFSREIVPALLFGAFVNVRNYYALPAGFILKRTDDAEPILYLRQPCTPGTAVKVRPWWDLATEVDVCPDAYRPNKWTMQPSEHSYRSRMVLTCDSQVGSPELETSSLCGCGPNLIRCMRDEEQYDQFNKSLMNEVKLTTAYVVEQDLPMASLFTGNATFRDRNVELYYRRQKIGALEIANVEGELDDLAAWPTDGRWAPRSELAPGQHAGVLTSPQILHWLPDRRQRQRGFYEIMWCTLRNSFGATTNKVLELNATANIAFVHDSWQRLAHTDLCTNCHARLDYGFQFFMGYPDSRASTHYTPAQALRERGALYGRDIQDLRGTAQLTPAGFATLATEQPDFAACVANHFVSYVLGDRATSEDRRAIEAAVVEGGRFKGAMKAALERYVARWRSIIPAPLPPEVPPPSGALVAINAPLRAQLDRHCADCHDEVPYNDTADGGERPFDFRPTQLPRALVVSMTDHVAFGTMPKEEPLEARAREELVMLLIDTLWSDPAARIEAERYHLGKGRGLPAHQVDNAIHLIDQKAQGRGVEWGAIERGIWSDQSTITPGFLALTGLEALRACAKARDERGVNLETCLDEATAIGVLSRWPVAP